MLKAGSFRAPGFLTLTVDLAGTLTDRWGERLAGFASSEAAYETVTGQRYVARLMHQVGVRTWAAVLEFQGRGVPHWHVLYERSEAGEYGWVDYKRLWHLWRDVWHIGLLDDTGVRFQSSEHAVNYITKYLVKYPDVGYPSWVWERQVTGHKGAIRFVSTSRALGPVFERVIGEEVEEAEEGDGLDEVEDEGSAGSDPRRYADIVAACGCESQVFELTADEEGEEKWVFLGELPVSPGHLVGDDEVVKCSRGILGLSIDDASEDAVVDDGVEGFWGQVTGRTVWLPVSWRARLGELSRGLSERLADVMLSPLPLEVVCGDVSGFDVVTGDRVVALARARELACASADQEQAA
jgi:hypothetical protein